MFEAYPSDGEGKEEFKKYHVIKVIPDDAVEVQVEQTEQVYRIIGVGESLQWEIIDTREEMENKLHQRNKRDLQQVSKEDEVPMQAWFQNLVGCDG